MQRRTTSLVVLFMLLGLAACGGGGSTAGESQPTPDGAVPEVALYDINPNSATNGVLVSSRDFLGGVSLWYFGQSSCEACRTQFAQLDDLQRDLETTNPGIGIQIVGVNEFDEWTGMDEMTEGRLLPLLQDETSVRVALLWGAVRRDLLVLDEHNEVIRVYHLDEYDLGDPGNYAELRQFLLDVAP